MADYENLKPNGHSSMLVRLFQKIKSQLDIIDNKKVDKISGKGLSTEDYTSAEKSKLNGIATGAEVNQNAFSNVTIGSTTIAADSKTDTLTLVAGSNVSLTPDAINDKITLSATLEKSAINSFTDGIDSYFKKVVSTITPQQAGSGTPSPSNVRAISGFTECTVVDRQINQWDEDWEVGDISRTTGENAYANSQIRSKNYILVSPDTLYYIGIFKTGEVSIAVCYYDADKNFISAEWSANVVRRTPINCYYIRFTSNAVYGNTYNNDISINYPATDTSYHTYNGTTATISFSSAGTVYSGTVDLTSGNLIVDRGYLQPTTVVDVATSSGKVYWIISNTLSSVNGVNGLMSSHFEAASGVVEGHCYITGNGVILVAVPTDQTLNTKTLADAWLSTNQPQFVYKLATPQTYQLTPTQLRSLVGTNNLTSNTGDTVEVEYITNETIADIYDNLNKTPCTITKLSTGIYDITIPSTARFGQRIYFQVFDTDSEYLEFDGSLTVTDEAVSSNAGGGLHTSGIWYPLPSSITGNTTLGPGATFRLTANAILTTDYYIRNIIYQVTHTGTVPTPRSLYDTIKWLEDDDWLSIECYVM